MAAFKPKLKIRGANSKNKPDHLGSVRIDVGDQRVHVLFYEGGRIRIRVDQASMVINECYLQDGQKNGFTVVGLKPG